MANEELDAALSLLLRDMEGDPGDRHEIWMRVRQILDTMRAEGLPPPGDLLRLEAGLAAEFEAEAGTLPPDPDEPPAR